MSSEDFNLPLFGRQMTIHLLALNTKQSCVNLPRRLKLAANALCRRGAGRKLRLKSDKVSMEVTSIEEIEAMVKLVEKHCNI